MDDREIVQVDAVCKQIFNLLEAFPRFKDQVVDCLAGKQSEPSPNTARGALMLRGPAKMLQTVAVVTMKGDSPTTAARFKPFTSRCKWLDADGLMEAVKDVSGTEGLFERLQSYSQDREFVILVLVELTSGMVMCQHKTGRGYPSVDDRGPWEARIVSQSKRHTLDNTHRDHRFVRCIAQG